MNQRYRTPFRNRQEILDYLANFSQHPPILVIYGEAGIGKTRLLDEAAAKMRQAVRRVRVLSLDGKKLAIAGSRCADRCAEEITSVFSPTKTNSPETSQQLLEAQHLVKAQARLESVWLVFDNAEYLFNLQECWDLLEELLFNPLAQDGFARQIFASRSRLVFKRLDTRIHVHPRELAELSDVDTLAIASHLAAQGQVRFLDDLGIQSIASIVHYLSFGHPLLSERITDYLAPRWQPDAGVLEQLKEFICRDIVKPTIDEHFLRDVSDRHVRALLEWCSILKTFDLEFVHQYILRVDELLAPQNNWFDFYNGIFTGLRVNNGVIWKVDSDYQLHGVWGSIMRRCLRYVDCTKYVRANLAAYEALIEIRDHLFSQDEPEYQKWTDTADYYRSAAGSLAC